MDPEATLSALRVWADSVAKSVPVRTVDTVRAAELFRELDSWLSRGGPMPPAWLRSW